MRRLPRDVETDYKADERQREYFAQHYPDNSPALRNKRNANSDFVRAARDM